MCLTLPPWAPAGFFFPGGGTFSWKKLTIFSVLVVAVKTQLLTVTANAQNTLQHFQSGKCPRGPCLRTPMIASVALIGLSSYNQLSCDRLLGEFLRTRMTETISWSARAAVRRNVVPTARKMEILDAESVSFVHGRSFVDSGPSLLAWRGAARRFSFCQDSVTWTCRSQ